MKKYICATILLCLLFNVELISQTKDNNSTPNWWTQSSRVDTSKQFLYHAQGRFTFSRTKGVISGVVYSGDIFLAGRKGIFTNYAAYRLDKMDLNLRSFVNLDYSATSHYFTDFINIDLSRIFIAEAGFIWERDDAQLINNRYSLYVGSGLNLVFFKSLKLKSLLAAGRINQEYIIPVDEMDVIKEPHFAAYFRLNYDWNVSKGIFLSGQADYFSVIKEADRYRAGINLNLGVMLVKNVKLIIGYSYKYNKENVRLGIIPENSMQNIGIEVSL
ncbi:MAG: DUF481 domain-containing protein [Bacteroidales bacterium]|nr:DUF481 domain-containing protein [Bacteroidales bacterium]MDD3989152.1 DUF481 domain-containing protein [Bacteroidales bacterium]MDD4638600.1 DUF481 domain-containing protein [Bacteroidales bacterium]